jgi:hypothetical protein
MRRFGREDAGGCWEPAPLLVEHAERDLPITSWEKASA